MQLDTASRGFSFMRSGPLDMRMNVEEDTTAADIVNKASEKELIRVIRDLGEEPRWRRAVQCLLSYRKRKKIVTTFDLLEALSPLMKGRIRGKLHPATLVFQGLRIAVNRELEVLTSALEEAIHLLAEGGRIAVLSFHRSEDRLVKETFRKASQEKRVVLITKKPLACSYIESRKNPRAKSAKLRVVEKKAGPS